MIKKKQSDRRRLISEKIVAGTCPAALSKFIASQLEPRKGELWEASLIIQSAPDSSVSENSYADGHDFSKPVALFGKGSEALEMENVLVSAK